MTQRIQNTIKTTILKVIKEIKADTDKDSKMMYGQDKNISISKKFKKKL